MKKELEIKKGLSFEEKTYVISKGTVNINTKVLGKKKSMIILIVGAILMIALEVIFPSNTVASEEPIYYTVNGQAYSGCSGLQEPTINIEE